MPRRDLDRDDFVTRIRRRRRLARIWLRARRLLGTGGRSFRDALYDATFRSDMEAVAFHYAEANDHLADLVDPRWLDEKIRWQFLHHPNPLMSLAADKIAVRDYLRFVGARIPAPRLIASGSDPAALAGARLPDSFVLKSNFGSGQNHVEKPGMHTPRAELIEKATEWMEFDQWRRTGEFHYRPIRKQWLVEEYLSPERRMYEYKVYCFMGEPAFLSVITDRGVDGRAGVAGVRYAVYDTAWNRLPFGWAAGLIDPADVPPPPDLGLLIEEARRLARNFLHVRVDFLRCDDRLSFSELTFASMAARVPLVPLSLNERYGDMMDLDRADEYLALGRSIAGRLGRREETAVPEARDTRGETLCADLTGSEPPLATHLFRQGPADAWSPVRSRARASNTAEPAGPA